MWVGIFVAITRLSRLLPTYPVVSVASWALSRTVMALAYVTRKYLVRETDVPRSHWVHIAKSQGGEVPTRPYARTSVTMHSASQWRRLYAALGWRHLTSRMGRRMAWDSDAQLSPVAVTATAVFILPEALTERATGQPPPCRSRRVELKL
ncbi:hypothetical protein K438DRAFT_1879110 [Mycena galopus ATCC 62051]|nr:hypothetical protein K438DRAFT_1879110 [Mycena galopus ATCC 62051]